MWILHEFLTACWEVLKLPFALIGIGWRRFWGLGVRRVLLFFFAALVVTVVALTVAVEATSQPGFCTSCHFMQPYFQSWEISSHKNIACIKCHIRPGITGTVRAKFMALSMVVDYATGVYKRSKPWAEIEDASCLRGGCHETRLLNGKVNFKGVVFDHAPHLTQPRRDRQLRCTSCHGQIVQGEHLTVTESTCFLCHFKPDSTNKPTSLARCTHCHRPPTGAAAADTSFDHASVLARSVDCLSCHSTEVSGDGYVPPERCNTCHAKLEHIQRYKDEVFVHQKHVTEHRVDCQNCHIAIRHGKEATQIAEQPGRECAACHGGPRRAYEATYTGNLPGLPKPAPSAMARVGMSCSACHIEPVHNNSHGFGKPQCSPCHTENYNTLWPMWKQPLAKALTDLEGKAKRMPESAKRDTLLVALSIFKQGNPVHNPDLMARLAEEITGSGGVKGENCLSCHPAAPQAAPLWLGRPVPHQPHANARIACTVCHETAEPNHGRLKVRQEQCNACHHQKAAAAKCEICHKYEADVFTGKITSPAGADPSTMAAAEVKCTDCHAVKDNLVTRRDPQACVGCHEAAFADTLNRWQQNADAMLTTINQRLKTLNSSTATYNEYSRLAAVLRQDGSRSVHNPRFFADWMKRIEATP